jgi:predicted nucleic acid-binding protein
MSAELQRYLDASALVKLVVEEPESEALSRWLGDRRDVVSCSLARTEIVRAVAPSGREATVRARRLLERIELVYLDDELLDLAGELEGPLRSLDAIHLAAALELGDELEAIVTYDVKMARAAQTLNLPVLAPA